MALWVMAALELRAVSLQELQWLKGPGRNAVHTGILNLLQNPNCTNEDVMRWVEVGALHSSFWMDNQSLA